MSQIGRHSERLVDLDPAAGDPVAEKAAEVSEVWRYPVKSMLGERLDGAGVDERGLAGDRRLALLHTTTGRVVSAKHPRLWRDLLTLRATGEGRAGIRVVLPDATVLRAADPAVDEVLSALLGEPVTLTDTAPEGAELERAVPEEVLRAGVDAEVPIDRGRIGLAAPPGTFVDFAPIHLVTTATLDRLAAAVSPQHVDPIRYRPNLVLRSRGTGFEENDWVGRELAIGTEVLLRVLAPTPRCAVPTLAHGTLPPQPDALRAAVRLNRIRPLPELGEQPCVGVYAQVLRGGRIREGDPVRLG